MAAKQPCWLHQAPLTSTTSSRLRVSGRRNLNTNPSSPLNLNTSPAAPLTHPNDLLQAEGGGPHALDPGHHLRPAGQPGGAPRRRSARLWWRTGHARRALAGQRRAAACHRQAQLPALSSARLRQQPLQLPLGRLHAALRVGRRQGLAGRREVRVRHARCGHRGRPPQRAEAAASRAGGARQRVQPSHGASVRSAASAVGISERQLARRGSPGKPRRPLRESSSACR